MSVLLSCQELTKSYSDRPLFKNISFGIFEGERAGLLGPNGSGKSTLLKLLAGLERPDSGVVATRRGVRLGYVPQEESFALGKTISEVLAASLADAHLDEHEILMRVEDMVAEIGFSDGDQVAETLSGGWKKRLAIACELIRKPDILLMDEPTNHLDLEGILWLEDLLKKAEFAYLVVSHDRYLLQNAMNRVIELSRAYGEGYLSVNGPYQTFLERKVDYLKGQEAQQDAIEVRLRKEIEWLGHTAAARSTKASYRIKEAGRMMDDLSELRFRNSQNRAAEIDFTASKRQTRDLVVAKEIEKSLGGKCLFRRLNLRLTPGVRLGLVGPNGSGKTTLLKLLAGEIPLDSGTIKHADDLRIVYFDQQREQLDRRLTLRDALAPSGGDTVVYRDRQMHIAAWAKRFLFASDELSKAVSVLSGGEQARVLIARLMLRPADVLILDEPTNNLDIPTLQVLEESLLEFPGAMVLVTHDREMLDRVATEVLGLDARGNGLFFADYSQWERTRNQAVLRELSDEKKAGATPPPAPVIRMSMAEQKELSRMEEKIEAAESKVTTLEQRMQDPAVAADHLKLQQAWAHVQAAQEAVAVLYARWEELEQKREASAKKPNPQSPIGNP